MPFFPSLSLSSLFNLPFLLFDVFVFYIILYLTSVPYFTFTFTFTYTFILYLYLYFTFILYLYFILALAFIDFMGEEVRSRSSVSSRWGSS